MEPKGSLAYSQEPILEPYPETAEFNPHPYTKTQNTILSLVHLRLI